MAKKAQDEGRLPEMTRDAELFITYAKTMKRHRWQHKSLTW